MIEKEGNIKKESKSKETSERNRIGNSTHRNKSEIAKLTIKITYRNTVLGYYKHYQQIAGSHLMVIVETPATEPSH